VGVWEGSQLRGPTTRRDLGEPDFRAGRPRSAGLGGGPTSELGAFSAARGR
jgi:hypothetical protein